MEPFIGQLMAAGFGFAPRGWALCNGQTLSIQGYQALFSLLGTTFGGNGINNFQLPNLQAKIPLSSGQLTGGSNYLLGQPGGEVAVTLLMNQVPPHSHLAMASTNSVSVLPPSGNALASNVGLYVSGQAPSPAMNANSIVPAGSSQPHENRQPFLVINWCIALVGVYPTRS
jgi:microcystin-dependent protein